MNPFVKMSAKDSSGGDNKRPFLLSTSQIKRVISSHFAIEYREEFKIAEG